MPVGVLLNLNEMVTQVKFVQIPLFQLQSQLLAAEKRPKYMETRDLSYFKEMMLIALDEVGTSITIFNKRQFNFFILIN